jgi:hypothetical protein
MGHDRLDPMDLPGPAGWRDGLVPSQGVFGYVINHVSVPTALIVAEVLWPRFIVVRGCVIIQDRYAPDDLAAWWDATGGDIPAIEAGVNHVHVRAEFQDRGDDDPELEAGRRALAQVIAATWRACLAEAFPERRFVVEATDDPEAGPTVSFYSA